LQTGDEKRADRTPQPLGQSAQQPSTWCGRSEQILLKVSGCEARKASAVGELFFLDFYLYRTYQALTLLASTIFPIFN
jgi:hypothetical protein